MNNPFQRNCHQRFQNRTKGQAFVEFGIAITVLVMFCFVMVELYRLASLSHRISTAVREAGRIYVAEEISPNPSLSDSVNATALQSEIETEIYERVKGMIAPADLPNKGRVIISILHRVDGYDDDPVNNPKTVYSDPTTEVDDYIEIEYQFSYGASNLSSVASKIGAQGYKFPNPNSIISLQALRIEERTVAVEILHETNMISGLKRFINADSFNYLYDRAIY